MLLVWIATWILESVGNQTAVDVWHWYGHHPIITLLLILFIA